MALRYNIAIQTILLVRVEPNISMQTREMTYTPIYTVFQKKFTPMTFMITMWNENQFK